MRSILLLLPVVVAAAAPQRPEQAAAPAPQMTLNVVALDSKGQNVNDLTAADIEIQDNGKPQKIVTFRRQDARHPDPAPLGPREFSNRSAVSLPHATIILFDLLNMRFEDRGYVFNQLSHTLPQFESAGSLYLYLLTVENQLYPVHALPENGAEPPSNDAAWTREIQSKLNDAMHTTMGMRSVALDIDTRVRETFATLDILAARLAGLPGRKNIVWITHGVPISLSPNRTVTGDYVDYTPYVRQLSQTLDRANVSIYAVQQSPPGQNESAMGAAEVGRMGSPTPETSPMAGMGSEATLTEFANLTGGRAWENNDISAAIKQAINDSRQSYLVSYTPPMENWDGKYHKLRITSRRKGVRLQTRQGYFAFVDQAATGKQIEDAMESAMKSPFDAAEIGLHGAADPISGAPNAVHLTVYIDLNDVELRQTGGMYNGKLAMRVLQFQDNGSAQQTKPATLNLRLNGEQRTEGMKKGYPLIQDLAVAPNAKKLRVIVFDDESAAIGSLTIPLAR